MIIGRSSIFFLASIFILNAFGLCMIYFIVFGDTFAALVGTLTHTDYDAEIYTTRWIYSVPLAVLLLPVVIQKELAELAWVGYVLFGSLGIFVVFTFVQLVFDP